jgi:hypothetical protein
VWVFLFYLLAPALISAPDTDTLLGRFARATGYAQTPAIFIVIFGLIPPPVSIIHQIIFVAVLVWMMAALTVAIRHTLPIQSKRWAVVAAATFLLPSIILLPFIP